MSPSWAGTRNGSKGQSGSRNGSRKSDDRDFTVLQHLTRSDGSKALKFKEPAVIIKWRKELTTSKTD